jgi:hypothetical protein
MKKVGSALALGTCSLVLFGCTAQRAPADVNSSSNAAPSAAPSDNGRGEPSPQVEPAACAHSDPSITWDDSTRSKRLLAVTRLRQKGSVCSVDEPLPASIDVRPISPAILPREVSDHVVQEGESKGLLAYSRKKIDANYAKQYLRQIKSSGVHLIFVGVVNVETSFNAKCGDSESFKGKLESWEQETTGVLACHRSPRSGSFAELAKKYCA